MCWSIIGRNKRFLPQAEDATHARKLTRPWTSCLPPGCGVPASPCCAPGHPGCSPASAAPPGPGQAAHLLPAEPVSSAAARPSSLQRSSLSFAGNICSTGGPKCYFLSRAIDTHALGEVQNT